MARSISPSPIPEQDQHTASIFLWREGAVNPGARAGTRGKLGRKHSPFGSKYIGSLQGMRKARKIGGLVEDLDANQAAASGQGKLGKARPMVKWHMALCPPGCPTASRRHGGSAPIVKTKLVPNGCAERRGLPRLRGLEMPSTPMAK